MALANPAIYNRSALLEKYSYDPNTGALTTKSSTGGGRNWTTKRWKSGRLVGSKRKNGYLVISLSGKQILAHRAIWIMVHGKYPACDIDHINGDKSDNRLANLRLANRGQNNVNSPLQKNNTSGYKGAYFDKRRHCWYAEIWVSNKKIFLGRFERAESAGKAYLEAAKKYFGEFARAA